MSACSGGFGNDRRDAALSGIIICPSRAFHETLSVRDGHHCPFHVERHRGCSTAGLVVVEHMRIMVTAYDGIKIGTERGACSATISPSNGAAGHLLFCHAEGILVAGTASLDRHWRGIAVGNTPLSTYVGSRARRVRQNDA
jgi:hypothetical protein